MRQVPGCVVWGLGLGVVWWVLMCPCGVWAQQSQKEYIWLDGKVVAVETNAFVGLTVAITSPTSGSSYMTTSGVITLSGSLSGQTGVTEVGWTSDRGYRGVCSGVTGWTCAGIPLDGGVNVLVVTAQDSAYGSGSDVLTVTRCVYGISPMGAEYPSGGGNGSVSVSTGSGCGWTAASNASWLTVTSGASGSGNGVVNYTVGANSGVERTGTLTVAGKTFTVYQQRCPVCGDGVCSGGEHCLMCPQDCCPGCDMQCMFTCMYWGGGFETCAAMCGCM